MALRPIEARRAAKELSGRTNERATATPGMSSSGDQRTVGILVAKKLRYASARQDQKLLRTDSLLNGAFRALNQQPEPKYDLEQYG